MKAKKLLDAQDRMLKEQAASSKFEINKLPIKMASRNGTI